MAKASVIIGTTVATGTFAIYGLSAIYSMFNFKFAFFTAGIALPLVGLIWIAFAPGLMKKAKAIAEEEDGEEIPLATPVLSQTQKSVGAERKLLFLSIFTLMAYAVFTNLIKDGLTTWVPNILKEDFHLPDSLSIIFTLALPMVMLFGNLFAVTLHKKVTDFVTQCALQFFTAGLLILTVILSLRFSILPLTVFGFAFACFFAGACNSIITSIFPLFMKGKVNSGLIAGILNGFCYVGSAISQYGLGSVSEALGSWTGVLWLLAIICAVVVVIAIIYHIIRLFIKKKKSQE
jgi:OPA family glycerol-3-phosphate transporter-like MFS transporter